MRFTEILNTIEFIEWPPMPDRSRVMIQTKRDTLVLQVRGLAWD
jgi:hypothetical protein